MGKVHWVGLVLVLLSSCTSETHTWVIAGDDEAVEGHAGGVAVAVAGATAVTVSAGGSRATTAPDKSMTVAGIGGTLAVTRATGTALATGGAPNAAGAASFAGAAGARPCLLEARELCAKDVYCVAAVDCWMTNACEPETACTQLDGVCGKMVMGEQGVGVYSLQAAKYAWERACQ